MLPSRCLQPTFSGFLGVRRWKAYDLAVLGGGPGGYVTAIKAAQNGLKVACIEERPTLGGTCLNEGCIPTKALLNMTHKVHEAKSTSKFAAVPSVAGDWAKMQRQKDQVVTGLTKGIEFLFRKNKIDFVKSRGRLASTTTIETSLGSIEASNIVLATGSIPVPMPGGFLPFDETRVLSSSGALKLDKVPPRLLIIGGGAIGLEFAAVYSRMGSKVEVIEFMPQIAVGFDIDVAQQLQKLMQTQLKVKFNLNHKVVGADLAGPTVKLIAQQANGESITFEGDAVLVAVGRKPNSRDMGLEATGVTMDKGGRVLVDRQLTTNIPSIRAIGDLIPGPMLAHKAEEDGCAAVSAILGHAEELDYTHCPAVIYTAPEVATVGYSEQKLKETGRKYSKGVFPLTANSRARANLESDGFVKVMSCPNSGEILGASIIGPNAGELVQNLVLARKFGISVKSLGETIFPHPTLSEAIKEAALAAAHGKAIHM